MGTECAVKEIHRVTCALAIIVALGCHREAPESPPTTTSPAASPVSTVASAEDDLAAARKSFVTRLKVRDVAPQEYADDAPPRGVQQVDYVSGALKLKGWLSNPPADGKRHPAVVYLHGGWAFAKADWADAASFVQAGFILFMPTLRAENGNPGVYESFYGEVDDAIAAGRYVSELSSVDRANVFVAGHSVGAVLTCLVAMMPSPYKAAADLDGSVDMESWAAESSQSVLVPYDAADHEEVRLRNPLAFVASLRCPLTLYAAATLEENQQFATKAGKLHKKCELVYVPGNHWAMVKPAVQKAIEQFQREQHE
jgi:dipeptidyl aminopeptidase/acylaminoacyl peptidase